MHTNRREFLALSALTGGAAMLGYGPQLLRADDKPGKASKPLKILILGGTAFLGPATVEAAQARGHTLTLFNRGKTRPQLFPDIEKLHGDRNGDLKSLEGRKWDVVLDNSGYFPRQVKLSAELLKDAVQHYIFISSISVYSDTSKPIDESSPVGKLSDESVEKITGETYGPLKALCEQTAERVFPGRATNIRPGLIVGPDDPSDRFTYWPVRIDRGGEVLAPGGPEDPIQVIDVRDLGAWIVRVCEERTMGVFNATGPATKLTMGAMLDACQSAAGKGCRLTWVDADFLQSESVAPWSDMPVWLPPRGESEHFSTVNSRKAITAGLNFRPIADTCKDTLAWFREQPEERRAKLKAGINPAREAEVLAAWHASKKK